MSFDFTLLLRCDNGCGAEEDYGPDYAPGEYPDDLPDGWERDYDNGDTIFGHVCGACIGEFEKESR